VWDDFSNRLSAAFFFLFFPYSIFALGFGNYSLRRWTKKHTCTRSFIIFGGDPSEILDVAACVALQTVWEMLRQQQQPG